MKKTVLIWLAAAALAAFGLVLYFFAYGHSFWGLLFLSLGALIACNRLLRLLQIKRVGMAKILRTALNSLLILGLLAYTVTLIPIIRAGRGAAQDDCAYIVVLGAKVNGQSPSLSLRDRIDATYEYMCAHTDVIAVVSGGQGTDEEISEAQCMYNELTKMGIDGSRIWLEDQSTSTWENLNFSLALIEEKTGSRPSSIGLVSSEYHLYRACMVAQECNVQAAGIPASTSLITMKLNYYLREVVALWYYMLF